MTNTGRKGRTHANVAREVRVSTTEDTSQLLEMAFGLHQAGELGRARGLYERIIEQDPGHADALHFLGMACFQQGDADRAAALIRRAIERKPQVAPYHDNLGAVLEFQGQLDEALLAYREAARLDGEVWFEDDSGDGVLSPGESGVFRLTLSNTGEGAAFNMVTMAVPDTLAEGLGIEAPALIPMLLPGRTVFRVVKVRNEGDTELVDIVFTFRILESNGFHINPPLKASISRYSSE